MANKLNVNWEEDYENWKNFQNYLNGNFKMKELASTIKDNSRIWESLKGMLTQRGFESKEFQDYLNSCWNGFVIRS